MAAQKDFQKGDAVIVRLTKDHQIGAAGQAEAHSAEFIAYHVNDRAWARVRLAEPHAASSEERDGRILDVPADRLELAEDSSAT